MIGMRPSPIIPAASAPLRAMLPLNDGTDGTGPIDAVQDLLAFLARRYSVGPKHLALPAPSTPELQQAAALAMRAPDHRQLRPLRFT
jgi:hypothetical protein